MARNPFCVETTIEYRSTPPVSAFQPETELLFGPDPPQRLPCGAGGRLRTNGTETVRTHGL